MSTKSSLVSQTLSILEKHHDSEKIYLAYSGGVDSHVLLHALVQCQNRLKQQIIAIHVNHGLSQQSGVWAQHCDEVCSSLNIELVLIELNAAAPKGESQEEWSRNLRYAAFSNQLGKHDILLTAHHKDDLAETLLLQLYRGAGPAGLSAIPERIELGNGLHIRPLLEFSRKDIADYAYEAGLEWIDDDSNIDERYDRNYLRHQVMPVLKNRWPGILKTLTRAAGIQSDVNGLIEDLAKIDLLSCLNPVNNALKQTFLASLSKSRAINVIRYWLKIQDCRSPSARILEQIFIDIVHSEADASPCVILESFQIRRYRDIIFLTQDLPVKKQINKEIKWDIEKECVVEFGKLIAEKNVGTGISCSKLSGKEIVVRYRSGHEKIKRDDHHHSLKNIFQESGIPPCFRELIPLIYVSDTLVEIAGLCIDEDYKATQNEEALQVKWDRAKEIYAINCL